MSIVDDEAIILGMISGNYIGLNEIATEIWSRLDRPIRISDLILEISGQFDEDLNVIKEDVMEFLKNLMNLSLIETIDEGKS